MEPTTDFYNPIVLTIEHSLDVFLNEHRTRSRGRLRRPRHEYRAVGGVTTPHSFYVIE